MATEIDKKQSEALSTTETANDKNLSFPNLQEFKKHCKKKEFWDTLKDNTVITVNDNDCTHIIDIAEFKNYFKKKHENFEKINIDKDWKSKFCIFKDDSSTLKDVNNLYLRQHILDFIFKKANFLDKLERKKSKAKTGKDKKTLTDTDKQPETDIDEQSETDIDEQSETDIDEQSETDIDEQSETDIDEQPETDIDEQPETIDEQPKTDIDKQPVSKHLEDFLAKISFLLKYGFE